MRLFVLFGLCCLVVGTMAAFQDVVEQLQALSPADRRRAVAELDLSDRIVVESSARPVPRKLRLFSGKSTAPSGEIDFASWRVSVTQLMDDDSVSDADKKKIILQNLLRPALDAVRSCDSARDILDILDNMYGSVVDGDDLLIQFHTTYQGPKESSSDFLQRIYLLLMETVEKCGATVTSSPKLLLKQFIRGCVDDSLVLRLKLEDQLDAPPSFAHLLLSVRKEESKAVERKLRLKAAGRVSSVVEAPSESAEVKELRVKVAQLESQVHQLSTPSKSASPVEASSSRDDGVDSTAPSSGKSKPRKFKRFYFCYRCGKEDHGLKTCTEECNPVLVQQKLEQRARLARSSNE